MATRLFEPMILQTKEEIMLALKQGQLKTAKYNLLAESEKRFVELVAFGGYTGEQAVRAINPGVKNPYAIANKVMSNPDVVATIEELTVAKDMKFKAEISAARDMALQKLQYIMTTTSDEALAASCAKTILDKAEAAVKTSTNKDEPVGEVKFAIQVENLYAGSNTPSAKKDEPVIIELTPDEVDGSIKEAEERSRELDAEIHKKEQSLYGSSSAGVNPETGLSYTLTYEGIDNYNKKEND